MVSRMFLESIKTNADLHPFEQITADAVIEAIREGICFTSQHRPCNPCTFERWLAQNVAAIVSILEKDR